VRTLWTATDAVRATGGETSGFWTASGVSIDTRSLEPGDLFVALRGPNRDGHDFVDAAFARGAAAAVVDREWTGTGGPLLRVADTQAGLEALARFARARAAACILAVTGSVGKTGTKEALRLAFGAFASTFAASGSLNNHWGVPLSLARLPPAAAYAVFELGMNHAGEIARLTRLVLPHIAIITTVEPAHLGFFDNVEAIADAKAEIFAGLEPGGIAILNRDNPHFARLAAAARAAGVDDILDFGADPQASVRLIDFTPDPTGSRVIAAVGGRSISLRLNVAGRHWAHNALAVLAALAAAGCDPQQAAAALPALEALPGRGRRHALPWQGGVLTLIDESYNASPAAMAAALDVLGATAPAPGGRRIAMLGDMLELGESAAALHRDLAPPLAAARVDHVFLIGSEMAALAKALPVALTVGLWASAEDAIPALLNFLHAGDVLTVKGSYSTHLGRIVECLLEESARSGS
jgi:UDP-N-acetylmuramoyl-tripeptide--D-alanyl-D-alanine ligase